MHRWSTSVMAAALAAGVMGTAAQAGAAPIAPGVMGDSPGVEGVDTQLGGAYVIERAYAQTYGDGDTTGVPYQAWVQFFPEGKPDSAHENDLGYYEISANVKMACKSPNPYFGHDYIVFDGSTATLPNGPLADGSSASTPRASAVRPPSPILVDPADDRAMGNFTGMMYSETCDEALPFAMSVNFSSGAGERKVTPKDPYCKQATSVCTYSYSHDEGPQVAQIAFAWCGTRTSAVCLEDTKAAAAGDVFHGVPGYPTVLSGSTNDWATVGVEVVACRYRIYC